MEKLSQIFKETIKELLDEKYESFRLRTITVGISLIECISPDWEFLSNNICSRLYTVMDHFAKALLLILYGTARIATRLGAEKLTEFQRNKLRLFLKGGFIQSIRLTITPFEILTRSAIKEWKIKRRNENCKEEDIKQEIQDKIVELAQKIELTVAQALDDADENRNLFRGVSPREKLFIGGYCCLLEKGVNESNEDFIDSLPKTLMNTAVFNASFNVATSRDGIDLDAIKKLAEKITEIAQKDFEISRKRKRYFENLEGKIVFDEIDRYLTFFFGKEDPKQLYKLQLKEFNEETKKIYRRHKSLLSRETRDIEPFWSNLARLAIFSNSPPNNPFMAGGYHGPSEPDISISIGINAAGVLTESIRSTKTKYDPEICDDLSLACQEVRFSLFNIYRFADAFRRAIILQLKNFGIKNETLVEPNLNSIFKTRRVECKGTKNMQIDFNKVDFKDGIVDLSLASSHHRNDKGEPTNSIAEAMRFLGASCGAPGSLAVLASLIDSAKKSGGSSLSYYGGLSGTFIPISEDGGMADVVCKGILSLDKYLALTSVCSVGIDMFPVYIDTKEKEKYALIIAGIIADEITIGVFNHKVTSVRILPVNIKPLKDKPGKRWVYLLGGAGLLGASPIFYIKVNEDTIPQKLFSGHENRIAAPITSLND